MKKKLSFFAILLVAFLTVGFVSWFAPTETQAATIGTASSFVPGEEYILTMSGTKMWVNGTYISGSTVYSVVAEEYSSGMGLAKVPTTVEAAQSSLWRISYVTSKSTVTMYSDYAGKYLNMSSSGATLSETPQALNATISGGTIKIYVTENGTNYYLRLTRGSSTVYGRWVVGTNANSTTFGLRTIQDADADTFVRPMRTFVSGEQYVLGRGGVTDRVGDTAEVAVVAGERGNGLQYAPRPATLDKATDCLWRITKNEDGTYVFYSDAAGKYINLSATEASLSDTPQNLNVSMSGRNISIYTVVDGTKYYLRFTNYLSTGGSGWHSGTTTNSNVFTLYTLQEQEKEYDNTDQTPLYSVACFADLHVDYGIQSWDPPIRQSTVNAVNYLKSIGGANVVLVGGDIVSNNDWGAAWTNDILKNVKDTVYNTMLEASTDSVVLPINGNHDSEPGNTAGGTVNSGDWEEYLLENAGGFISCLRNPNSKFNEVICYRYNIGGMEFLNINQPYRSSGDGHLAYDSQVTWIKEQLENIGKEKTVIMQWHFPLGEGMTQTDEVAELLKEYPNVIYCYGHWHSGDCYAWYATSERVRPLVGSETQNEDNSWTVEGALTCFMGSMAFYRTQYQGSALGSAEPSVVQFLKIDFYEDHITFRYYNTGEKSGDPDVYEIASYTVARDMKEQLTTTVNESYVGYAKDAEASDTVSFNTSSNGVNFFDFGNTKAGQSVTYKIYAEKAGDFCVGISYCTGSVTDRRLQISVNGVASQEVSFPRNSSKWGADRASTFSYQKILLPLEEGENIVTLTQFGSYTCPQISDIVVYSDYVVKNDVTVNLSAKLSGGTLKAGDITFTLTVGDKIYTAVNDESGNATVTISVADIRTGNYTVTQATDEDGIVLSDAQTMTISLSDDGNGGITATASDVIFKNTYFVPFAEGKIVDGKYIVSETGKATEMGLIKIGDDHYYVGPNGVLVTSQKYYAWRLNENCTDINVGWYYFNAEGKLVTDGIVDGYYYVDGKPTEMGLFQYTDGNYYVAQYDGKIITDRYFVWKIDESASQFATGWYDFNEDGTIIPWKNGIHDGYYYVNDKPTEMGLFEYEGKYYVAQYDGKIITDKYYVWKTQEGLEGLKGWRYFDETTGELLNGVVGEYYYEDGKRVDKGLIEWDGSYYFAQSGGKLVTSENYTKYGAGKYYVWKVDESAKDAYSNGWYYFDENGRLIQD